MEVGKIWRGVKPVLMMVMVQMSLSGVNIFSKLAANDGFNTSVLVAYRFLFATAFIAPIALIIERNKRPKLTWLTLFQAFICGIFSGSLAQNLYVDSVILTSATFVAASTNLTPPVTFILGIILRMEKLAINTRAGQAKVAGTLLGISGAMLFTFYKGAELDIWSTHINLMQNGQHHGGYMLSEHKSTFIRIIGPILALGACFSTALGYIFQAQMSRQYPCPYSSTALISVMASLQSIVYALCVERDWSQWKLGWNIRLLTVAYSGMLTSGLMVTFIMTCVRIKGPLFVSIFSPLMLVLVAIVASLLIDEKLHVGSVLGGSVIIIALYMVLWGKSKELKKTSELRHSQDYEEPQNNIATTNTLGMSPSFALPTILNDDVIVDGYLYTKKCVKEEENGGVFEIDSKV